MGGTDHDQDARPVGLKTHVEVVGSDRSALRHTRDVGFSGPPSEPDVQISVIEVGPAPFRGGIHRVFGEVVPEGSRSTLIE